MIKTLLVPFGLTSLLAGCGSLLAPPITDDQDAPKPPSSTNPEETTNPKQQATAVLLLDHEADISALSRDGRWVAWTVLSSSGAQTLKLAELSMAGVTGTRTVVMVPGSNVPGQRAPLRASFSDDGLWLAYQSRQADNQGYTLRVLRTDGRGADTEIASGAHHFRFWPEEPILLTASDEGVVANDLQNGRRTELPSALLSPNPLGDDNAFSPDHRHFAFLSSDRASLRIYAHGHSEIRQIQAEGTGFALAPGPVFPSNGRVAASGGGHALVWDISTGQSQRFAPDADLSFHVADNNGHYVRQSSYLSGDAQYVSTTTSNTVSVQLHERGPTWISPAGDFLALASAQEPAVRSLTIVRAADQARFTVRVPVQDFAFSPKGRFGWYRTQGPKCKVVLLQLNAHGPVAEQIIELNLDGCSSSLHFADDELFAFGRFGDGVHMIDTTAKRESGALAGTQWSTFNTIDGGLILSDGQTLRHVGFAVPQAPEVLFSAAENDLVHVSASAGKTAVFQRYSGASTNGIREHWELYAARLR